MIVLVPLLLIVLVAALAFEKHCSGLTWDQILNEQPEERNEK